MLNKSQIIGRITKKPTIIKVDEDSVVTNITIAVRRDYKEKDTREYESDFFTVAFWDHNAEKIVKNCDKSTKVYVEYKSKSEWNEDIKRLVYEFVGTNIIFL